MAAVLAKRFAKLFSHNCNQHNVKTPGNTYIPGPCLSAALWLSYDTFRAGSPLYFAIILGLHMHRPFVLAVKIKLGV
ncbi:hypothetical protein BDB00DRAFT_838996 [Zychaea mexicana]|uniref:uncharacterized protein n=1 Tax=Zychaea mexicana TaxID=64656 RepID=UPI0022FF251D|nr:uncharacterized protein BDB00DRAFT_838996 [Zychaea mexicana]KAI9490264.1 hypothetical protein BDB00DRAFT_838996 [Zychaea mexicana]